MADHPGVSAGPAAEWLRARREELNSRFRAARRRYPRLDPGEVLRLVPEVLAPLAPGGEAATGDLLAAVYDLILLHAARGTLSDRNGATADAGRTSPGLALLLRETFPRLRRLLLERPRSLPAALSNAVENLGPRGEEFARVLGEAGEFVESADDLLQAGALVAWRLGEARLRAKALDAAEKLPPRAVLAALRLAWPPEAAPLAVAALRADGWRAPGEALLPETIESLRGAPPAQVDGVLARLRDPATGPGEAWRPVGTLGDFRGFGGPFDEPPLLLEHGEDQGRHRFRARSGDQVFRLEGDVFGWTAVPDSAVDGRTARAASRGRQRPPRQATSSLSGEDFLAFTLPDSFRIRIWTPAGAPR